MKRVEMKSVIAAISFAIFSSVVQAVPIFSDNFDANGLALNGTPTGWTVTNGTVDIIGNPGFFDFIPGSGRYIDLDGSTSDAGVLSRSLALDAGVTYTLAFELAGNQRNGITEQVTVNFGGNTGNLYSLAQTVGWTPYSLTFTPGASGNYVISFENAGGDNIGMLFDDVTVDKQSQPVPEPGSLALLGFGLAGICVARRRKSIVNG